MTRKEAQTLLDSLYERLEHYRSEKAITAYAPLNFDLKKRIEELETQIENLRNLLAQSQAENIEFPNLARLKKLAFMDLEAQDKSEFIKVSYSFLKDCKNVVKNSIINAKTVHIGDSTHVSGNGNQVFQNVSGSTIHTGKGHIIKGDYKEREINIGKKGKYIENLHNLSEGGQIPNINIYNQNDNKSMVHQENVGNASVSGSGNSTNTNTNTNTNSQTIDFQALEQKLPNFQSELDSFKKEMKRALRKTQDSIKKEILEDLIDEAQDLLDESKEVKQLATSKDDDELKSKGFWKNISKFLGNVTSKATGLLNPKSMQDLGKTASEIAKIGQACGIDTGFDYANYGSE